MGPFSANIQRHNLISGIDARLKMLSALVVLVMALSHRGFTFPAVTTLLCLALIFHMRVPVKALLLRFGEPLFIAVVIIVLKLFFSGKEALFSLNILGMQVIGHKDGLIEGMLIGNRIISAVTIVATLGFSTPFTEFMAALSWFRMPKGFVEILMFAYRYIFALFDDAMVIFTAQKNRLGYSSIRRGLSSFGVLAGSLTLKAFENSQNTTIAMVQRGYDGTIPLLKHKSFKLSEVAVSIILVFGMGLLWKM